MSDFDLDSFLPYLLNQSAERTGEAFEPIYRDGYGWSRTQWRIIANLGQFGPMTASDICKRTLTEKSKVSRALAGLEDSDLLVRKPSAQDRRAEILDLTEKGRAAFAAIGEEASRFNEAIRTKIGHAEFSTLIKLLKSLRTSDTR